MKTASFIFLFSFILLNVAKAQIVAEDSKGESSIITKNSNVSFSLNDAALSASWNNFRKLAVEKPVQLVWGLSASGNNREGIADLFNGGKLTPQSKVGVFIGFRKSYQTTVLELLKRIKEIEDANPDKNEAAVNAIRELNKQIAANRSTRHTQSLTAYVNGGLNADNFKLYKEDNATSLSKRFEKVNFRGGFVDIGLNYEYAPRWIFGVSLGYERYNNLDSLGYTSYTLTNTTTVNNSQLATESKISAYQGAYMAYNRVNIKTDALYFGRISEDYRLVWNTLYTRIILPLQQQQINKVFLAGTAVNFYKSEGKFAGGLYLQSNDVFNSLHSTDKFHERLSFGIAAKYTFSSIVSRDFAK
ncbi:hypothetical protein TH53_07240 [Pedobacter lusitanus]|uniref:Uncharacterized protein n=1 Tax=Pedobacter lusitanus TaxID=1503925 RepID=A0A0D0GTC8_9SPHI|nr:hypothetical protein [Pedobacter lusitanus]KIO77726.1 hypothetical protein TH53_07240 [Pedobacter lusitanus]